MNAPEDSSNSLPNDSKESDFQSRVAEYQRLLKMLKDEPMQPKDRKNLRDYLESEAMSLYWKTLLAEIDPPTNSREETPGEAGHSQDTAASGERQEMLPDVSSTQSDSEVAGHSQETASIATSPLQEMLPDVSTSKSGVIDTTSATVVQIDVLDAECSSSQEVEFQAHERSKESPLLSAPIPDPYAIPSITNSEELQRLRERHVRGYDKWIRMSAGAASYLISYQYGVLELELRIARGKLGNTEKLVKAVPQSWRNLDELRQAYGFIMRIYETHHCDILLEIMYGRFQREEK